MEIEREVLEKSIQKDRKAQYQLYRYCFSMLIPICYRYVKDEETARELLNAAFLKILNNLKKLQKDQKLSYFNNWSKRVLVNHIIDEYRKNKNKKLQTSSIEEINTTIPTTDNSDSSSNLLYEDLMQLVRKLPPVTGKVFNLYVIDGFNHKEIGNMLRISTGTSKWHLSNARKKLKESIHNEQQSYL